MSEEQEPHESDPSVNVLTRWIIYIFIAILLAIPVLLYLANQKGAESGTSVDWLQPCYAKQKNSEDEIDCISFKSEVRAKYKLQAKKSEVDETEDNRLVVKELEELLARKKSDGSEIDKRKAPEAAMNNRMEIANLEYEIDKLSDFIPEIKARNDKKRKHKLAKKKESDQLPHYHKRRVRHPMEITIEQIKQKHGEYYTK